MLFFLLDECTVNPDCPENKVCNQRVCVDPCRSKICGQRATCEVDFRVAICVCEPGLQGNPLVACTEVGCRSHDECSRDQVCDFLPGQYERKECQYLCRPGKCHRDARCSADNHRETCTCIPPKIGDGVVSCYDRESTC